MIYHINLHHRTLSTCSLSNKSLQWLQMHFHHPHWSCVYMSSQFNYFTFLILPFPNRTSPSNLLMDLTCQMRKILTNVHHGLIYHIALHYRTLGTCSLSNKSLQWLQVPFHHPHWPWFYMSTQFNLLNLVYEIVLLCIENWWR